jgi:hypothetical protein
MSTLSVMAAVLAGFAAVIAIAYFTGRRSGIATTASDGYRSEVRALQREQAAAARAPVTKDAIVERLRNGGGL